VSLPCQHDVVPRFSIYNVYVLKEEMDATKWGDSLLATAKDWAVPDIIEKTEAYQKFSRQTSKAVNGWAGAGTRPGAVGREGDVTP